MSRHQNSSAERELDESSVCKRESMKLMPGVPQPAQGEGSKGEGLEGRSIGLGQLL